MGTRILTNSGFYFGDVYIIHQLNKKDLNLYTNNREYFLALRVHPNGIKSESPVILGSLDDTVREDGKVDFIYGFKNVEQLIDSNYKSDL